MLPERVSFLVIKVFRGRNAAQHILGNRLIVLRGLCVGVKQHAIACLNEHL